MYIPWCTNTHGFERQGQFVLKPLLCNPTQVIKKAQNQNAGWIYISSSQHDVALGPQGGRSGLRGVNLGYCCFWWVSSTCNNWLKLKSLTWSQPRGPKMPKRLLPPHPLLPPHFGPGQLMVIFSGSQILIMRPVRRPSLQSWGRRRPLLWRWGRFETRPAFPSFYFCRCQAHTSSHKLTILIFDIFCPHHHRHLWRLKGLQHVGEDFGRSGGKQNINLGMNR